MSLNKNAADFTPSWFTPAATASVSSAVPKKNDVPSPAPAALNGTEQKTSENGAAPPAAVRMPWKSPSAAAAKATTAPPAFPTTGPTPLSVSAAAFVPREVPTAVPALSAVPTQLPSVGNHDAEETRKIAQLSDLKLAAADFVPAFLTRPAPPAEPSRLSNGAAPFVPHRSPGTATARPPMPSVKQIDVIESAPHEDPPLPAAEAMPLESGWVWLYGDSAGTEQYDPFEVNTVRDVATFWRTFNNIPAVSMLNVGATYYLFKDGVTPKWEDPANVNGGSWSLRFITARDKGCIIDGVWERLCCRTIGNSWDVKYCGDVTGLVAKVRERYITLQVWVTRRVDEFPSDIMAAVSDVFSAFQTSYVSHMSMAESALLREKEKTKEKKGGKKTGGGGMRR